MEDRDKFFFRSTDGNFIGDLLARKFSSVPLPQLLLFEYEF